MSILEIKVGAGFAFLLYYAVLIAYALIQHASFAEVAPWLAGGAAGQIGQRAVTQVMLSKGNGSSPAEEEKK